MAKLIFGLTQSLDGYVAAVDGDLGVLPLPDDALFAHFVERERGCAGTIYGRRVYEIMRYWEEEQPEWGPRQRDYAALWRAHPKWVASRTLSSVANDCNYTLVEGDIEPFVRKLKAEVDGDILVAGPEMARSLTELGLIDEYHLYLRPVVLGGGKPFFAGARSPLRFVAMDRLGEDAVRLIYEPA
jgi:dihydrofolate reductase